MGDLRDHPTSVRSGEELDLSRLEPFLRSHFPDATGTLSVSQFPSGHSNLTYLVCLGNRQMVLRRPPFGSKVKTAHDMSRSTAYSRNCISFTRKLRRRSCTVKTRRCSVVAFYVMERVQGIILRRDPPAGLVATGETARQLSEVFIDNLARLHGLDYTAIGLADLGNHKATWVVKSRAGSPATTVPGHTTCPKWKGFLPG